MGNGNINRARMGSIARCRFIYEMSLPSAQAKKICFSRSAKRYSFTNNPSFDKCLYIYFGFYTAARAATICRTNLFGSKAHIRMRLKALVRYAARLKLSFHAREAEKLRRSIIQGNSPEYQVRSGMRKYRMHFRNLRGRELSREAEGLIQEISVGCLKAISTFYSVINRVPSVLRKLAAEQVRWVMLSKSYPLRLRLRALKLYRKLLSVLSGRYLDAEAASIRTMLVHKDWTVRRVAATLYGNIARRVSRAERARGVAALRALRVDTPDVTERSNSGYRLNSFLGEENYARDARNAAKKALQKMGESW